MCMFRCILLLVKSLGLVFAFFLVPACLPLSAWADQSVTVKSSSVTNGTVSIDAESAGQPVSLDCNLRHSLCSVLASGNYEMRKTTTEGVNDCTDVILYKTTVSGQKEKVGVTAGLTAANVTWEPARALSKSTMILPS
jgi:hypothetical protein